ncbi:multiple sugar transport system permease protein [Anaeroplasma bactoclasticum]|jgi:multiple sugar transport system permease protein|uniref:Multiple sugar transport system permease protein n=1 Tax=Anaeroplasma bactoclasticum TaxID=2088 RepID=A0A397RZY3_9MOLU|nr:sugar ABC transporter permease [Anaeroplasma bactoclasticum]RIA75901.1 multiple sugar transport system permease protein [Anaeroplasma bactoclasticum]
MENANVIKRETLSTTRKKVNYAKWGYILILPFFVVYAIFSLWPLIQTFYYSFLEYRQELLDVVGPNFIGFQNYATLFSKIDFWKYLWNTIVLWLICFIPQIVVSLLLAVWFTDRRLKIKGQRFFKTVIYMPNLIMAAAFGFLFMTLLSRQGPIMSLLMQWGWISTPYDVSTSVEWNRIMIGLINFIMWFGNTTLLLMSGVMGIDEDIFEAATVDGAGAFRTFKDVTMPLLKPIFIYVFITSLIGGIQLFDVAVMFNKAGGPNLTSNTLVMYLNQTFSTRNYGMSGAISVLIFILTASLSVVVYFVSYRDKLPQKHKKVIANGK